MLIIPSGLDITTIHECIVESDSSLTPEVILKEIFNVLKTKKTEKEYVDQLSQFILRKSEEESLNCYLEHYTSILILALRCLGLMLYFLEKNNAYAEQNLRYKYIKQLDSSDLILSVKNLCKTKNQGM